MKVKSAKGNPDQQKKQINKKINKRKYPSALDL